MVELFERLDMKVTLTFIIVMVFCDTCQGFVSSGQYRLVQGSADVGSMRCLASLNTTARGAEFDTSGDICNVLNTSWFDTPILQPGRNYYELVELTQFKQTKFINTTVPDNFRLGDSIVLYMEEAIVSGTVKFRLALFDVDADIGRFGATDHIYFHIHNDADPGYLTYRSFVNGVWTANEDTADPYTSETGKLELVVTNSTVLAYVNDVNVYNYTTHLPVPPNLIIYYQGDDTICSELQFSYKTSTTQFINTPVPDNFQLGDSIVLYLEKEKTTVGTVKFRLDLIDGNANIGQFGVTDHIYVHIRNDFQPGILTFTSFVNGNWTAVEDIADTFTSGKGKLELLVTESTILAYVNDVNVYNFTTHLPVPPNLIVYYQGDETVCSGLQFFD